jgi:hypothetical protein
MASTDLLFEFPVEGVPDETAPQLAGESQGGFNPDP